MRPIALSAAILAACLASPAFAAPKVAYVQVSAGEDLRKKTDMFDEREIGVLTTSLKKAIERALPATEGGGTLSLVIEDAKPNRPTMVQMAKTPGLSFDSFGLGGARISGSYVDPTGAKTPIAYSWYETDIRWARYRGTWSDADKAFGDLARRLAKDQFTQTR
ncbi:MAG: hypothetical protein J7521_14630 [Caulobacter sp.]|nr:hypothetical protein [Caulobacter sp.]